MSSRVAAVLASVALGLLAAASAAEAKEGVEGTLHTSIPAGATPGTRLTLEWSLADHHGRPFGAGGLFVRLRGPDGAFSEAYADGSTHPDGRYRATVTVPRGGVDSVEVGLRGIVSGPEGTKRGDLLFPLATDPLARPAAADRPSSRPGWMEAGAGGAVVLAAAALVVHRRRRVSRRRA